MRKNIGQISYSSGSPEIRRGKIQLYEAIQFYLPKSTSRLRGSHVYILAKNREEANEVKNAWLKRNGGDGLHPK